MAIINGIINKGVIIIVQIKLLKVEAGLILEENINLQLIAIFAIPHVLGAKDQLEIVILV